MTDERIERTLADFRDWLKQLSPVSLPIRAPEKPGDLFTLTEQFVALKQEVNLQTRATRTTLEQNAEALKQLSDFGERLKQTPSTVGNEMSLDEKLKPLLKAIIDAYDSLAMAQKQIEKQRDSLDAALETLQEQITLEALPPVSETIPTPVEAVGFWGRLLGNKPLPSPVMNPLLDERVALDRWRTKVQELIDSRQEATEDTANFIDEALSGLLTGYEMSLSRIDKVLSRFDLEVIASEGEPFDPESMEAVEVVRDSGEPAGRVLEEVRRGYRWRGTVFRYAQVKVAR